MKSIYEISQSVFGKAFHELHETEQKVIRHFASGTHVSRSDVTETQTFGERLADKVASFGGSWYFIILFVSILISWVTLNGIMITHLGHTFDPYPYILLNLILSMMASFQAPIIMMSQNRRAEKDRIMAEHDYSINLKAELEIAEVNAKLDKLMQKLDIS